MSVDTEMAPARTDYLCPCCGAIPDEQVLTTETPRGLIRGHRRRDYQWGMTMSGHEVQTGSGEWITCGPINVVEIPEETLLRRALRSTHFSHPRLAAGQVSDCPLCVDSAAERALTRGDQDGTFATERGRDGS